MGLSVMCNERWSFSGIELRTAANFRTSAEICRVPTVDKMLPIKWGIALRRKARIVVTGLYTAATVALLNIIHEQGRFRSPTVNDVLLYAFWIHVHRRRILTRGGSEVLRDSLRGIAVLKSLDNFVHIKSG
jgi:hypothetical protein